MTVDTHDSTRIKPLPAADAARQTSPASPLATMVFAGDFYMAPRPAPSAHAVRRAGDMFDPAIIDALRGASIAVVNLEGPISDRGEPIAKVGPHLRMDQSAADVLADLGVDVATLANNHVMDYGPVALDDTIEHCARRGVQTVGAGASDEAAYRPVDLTLCNGLRVAVFSVCEREFGVSDGQAGTAWISQRRVESAVRHAKERGSFVVVCAHGGIEDVPLPPVQRRQQLRALVDAGADLVIGHHPHVPQGWEQYGQACIFYSVGDFYFDTVDGARTWRSDWGCLVRAHLSAAGLCGLDIVPYERVNDVVAPLGRDRDRQAVLDYLNRASAAVADDRLADCWQTLAADLMQGRYEPFFRQVFAQTFRQPQCVREATAALAGAVKRSIKRRLGLNGHGSFADDANPKVARWRRLLLLNLLRCESHRWSIESALSGPGDEPTAAPDADARRQVDELMQWMKA